MTAEMSLTEWAAWRAGRGVPPRLNPPATPADIAAAEQKLGLGFPADLRELYLQANGSEGGLL